ncbi:hypothetical protein HanIR_Chr13g0617591 [Helianthus annuus]|nr:hypothetical protein HanIR_Chr13g0617591 [Helianthus annuus]
MQMFNIQTLPSMRTICLSRTGLDLYRSWPCVNKSDLAFQYIMLICRDDNSVALMTNFRTMSIYQLFCI